MASSGIRKAYAGPVTDFSGSQTETGHGDVAAAGAPSSEAQAGVDNKGEVVTCSKPGVATHASSSRGGAGTQRTTVLRPEVHGSNHGGSSNTLERNRATLSRAWNLDMPLRRAKKLLILNVNGLLVASYNKEKTWPQGIPHSMVGWRCVIKRPFCDAFLEFCFENFRVGIWSSMMEKNAHKTLDFICKETKHKLAFVMHQEDCTDTGLRNPENKYKPIFLKELRKAWSRFQPGEFDQTNTLLVDDTPYKALRNPPCTAIFPATYTHNEADNFLAGALREFLEGLSHAADVQKFVRENPIGAPAIAEGCSHWALYRKIVDSDVTALSAMEKVTVPAMRASLNGPRYEHGRNRRQKIPTSSGAQDAQSLEESLRNLALNP